MYIRCPISAEPPAYVNAADGGPYVSSTAFDIDAGLAIQTIESIGPTGSGADNIWTALDDLPLGVKWVALRVFGIFRHATLMSGGYLWARQSGSSVLMTALTHASAVYAFSAPASASDIAYDFRDIVVPVSALNMFDLRYDEANAGHAVFSMGLRLAGFGYNGAYT